MTLYKTNSCLYKHKCSYFYPLILYNLIILKKRFMLYSQEILNVQKLNICN